MCMLDEIHARRDEVYAIARKYKAEKLWVFGSCARKEERPDSDVDFLVSFQDGASLFTTSRLKHSLSEHLVAHVFRVHPPPRRPIQRQARPSAVMRTRRA